MTRQNNESLNDIDILQRQAAVAASLRQAVACFQQGRMDEAERIARNILNDLPDHPAANHILGLMAGLNSHYDVAEKMFHRAIEASPENEEYHMALGLALYKNNKLQSALAAWTHAAKLKPDLVEAHYYCGLVMCECGRFDESLDACDRALQFKREWARVHNVRGDALHGLGRTRESIASYQQSVQYDPAYLPGYNNLGNALREVGSSAEALRILDHALRIEPKSGQLHINRGLALKDLGRLDEALECCKHALMLDSDKALAYNAMGAILKERHQYMDALESYECALQCNPDFGQAHINRGNTLFEIGLTDVAERSIRHGLELTPDDHVAHSNLLFILAAQAKLSSADMLIEQQRWDILHGHQGRIFSRSDMHSPNIHRRRLRVGYVSPDFRQHAVSQFFEPLLRSHDRSRFEIFCYATHASQQNDETTLRLRTMSENWHTVGSVDDLELVNLIKKNGIDILVDLAGHTAAGRLKMFTYRPAPVQVTYLGYFAGTGLEAMDYWISDEILHPLDTSERATEQIYRLPRCWVCYKPLDNGPLVSSRPNDNRQVVFGSFNNISKLLPPVIEAWSEILSKVPGSQLLLMDKLMADEKTRHYMLEKFARYGISSDRLIIELGKPVNEYLSTYAKVDVVLDPFPRTGGTTTADALWMGVPVLTLAGSRYVERISASKLTALGLENLITHTVEDYINLAVILANDTDFRQKLRASLRDTMMQSPLCDGRGLAHVIESAYLDMWERRTRNVT